MISYIIKKIYIYNLGLKSTANPIKKRVICHISLKSLVYRPSVYLHSFEAEVEGGYYLLGVGVFPFLNILNIPNTTQFPTKYNRPTFSNKFTIHTKII